MILDEFETIFRNASPSQRSRVHETIIISVKSGLLGIQVKEKKYFYTHFVGEVPLKNITSVVISDEFVNITAGAYGHTMNLKIKLEEI